MASKPTHRDKTAMNGAHRSIFATDSRSDAMSEWATCPEGTRLGTGEQTCFPTPCSRERCMDGAQSIKGELRVKKAWAGHLPSVVEVVGR